MDCLNKAAKSPRAWCRSLPLIPFILLVSAGQAMGEFTVAEVPNFVTANSAVSVMSMHDMEGDRWVFEVSPGYWRGLAKLENVVGIGDSSNEENVEPKGFVIAAAIKREFSPHWGMGFMAGGGRQKGGAEIVGFASLMPTSALASFTFPTSVGAVGGEIKGMFSQFTALIFTFDPFSDPDGFRLPITVGPIWVNQGFDFQNEYTISGQTQTESLSQRRSWLGGYVNASFDFLLFNNLRVMPGILYGRSFGGETSADYDYIVTNGGTTRTFAGEITSSAIFPTVYLSLMYRPWNLSLNYTLPVADSKDVKVSSLRWSKKW